VRGAGGEPFIARYDFVRLHAKSPYKDQSTGVIQPMPAPPGSFKTTMRPTP
jgi:hypothetical protein